MSASTGRSPSWSGTGSGAGVSATSASAASAAATAATTTIDPVLQSLLASETDFSVAAYLNRALDVADEKEEERGEDFLEGVLQQRMAELALQLQVQTQSCHDDIGRIGAELRAILPRCHADVGRLEVGLEAMRDDATSLFRTVHSTLQLNPNSSAPDDAAAADVEDSEVVTAQSSALETLSTLHALKFHLLKTKSILSAAASWDSTLSKIPTLLANSSNPSSLQEAVVSLAKLEDGERALQGMPGRPERLERLGRVRQQMELLLRPQLRNALQSMDRLGPLQQVASMYNTLGKSDALIVEYVAHRPTAIHQLWFSTFSNMVPNKEGKDDDDFDLDDDGTKDGREGDDKTDGFMESSDGATDADGVVRQSNFVEWLPTWFESVLTLLSEERMRASTIFGSHMTLEIMIKVLSECFRPILSSYKTRLSTLCVADGSGFDAHAKKESTSTNLGGDDDPSGSSDLAGGGVGGGHLLEAVCATFQSSLQFLSLAYDQMSGLEPSSLSSTATTSAGHAVDGSFTKTKTAQELYSMIRTTLVAVASPFGDYQRNFAMLEQKHSELAARMVARDVRAAVSSTASLALPNLQDAMEKLAHLTPYMFPLVDAAVARFELLNCGHKASSAMGTIDSVLADHVRELTVAIETLSATTSADGDRLADSFDEQHVLCALEVLKIAGSLHRGMNAVEAKTRERLRSLHSRMADHLRQEQSLAAATTRGGRSIGVTLPDSLSALEIASILANAACNGYGVGTEDADATADSAKLAASSLAELERLASPASTGVGGAAPALTPLFPNAVNAGTKLAGSCHTFVFDVCAAVPRRCLKGMSNFPVWRESSSSAFSALRGAMDINASSSYGTLPQSYITTVGEHMLALVQALEPFASDPEALGLASGVMRGAKDVALKPWRDFVVATGCGDGDKKEVVAALLHGKELADLVGAAPALEEDEDDEDGAGDDDGEGGASAAFCNEWLDVVGSAVTGILLERIMRIPALGSKGCEHLAADLNYLVNVFTALGVSGHPHPLLSHVASFVTLDPATVKEVVASRSDGIGRSPLVLNALKAAEMRLASMRGISTS